VFTKVAHFSARSIRYFEAGSGRAVVFLHAFPLSADQWLPQLHRVPPGWRFIAPDLRGFRGGGPAYEDPGVHGVTMDGYVQDVLELMAHVEIDRAVVCGLSMGGYVALALQRRAAARVAGLLLANTRAGADSADGKAARDRMIDLVTREGAAAVAREMIPKLLGATAHRDQPDLADVVSDLIRMNAPETIAAAVAAMRDRPDSTPGLATVACPTWIVTGAEDALVPPSESEAMHRAIPGSRLVVLPHVGHLSNIEAPLAFSDVVAALVAAV
jgi:3-oxoadipate enol-lactonase